MHRDIQPSIASQGYLSKKRCIIVGSGPSAKGFIPPDGITIIAVNGVIEWIERADYWFSLDPSEQNLKRIHNRRKGVHYCVAFPPHIRTPAYVERFQRISFQGDEPFPKFSQKWWAWRWSAQLGLCTIPGCINTGNSSFGGLGLAYHLGITRVALVGVDATQEPRIGGGEPNNLSHLPLLFASARKQIDVVSCGKLTGIPQMSLQHWIEVTDDNNRIGAS